MDLPLARQLNAQIAALVQQQAAALADDPPPTTVIKTPAELDHALAASQPGDVFLLDPFLIYSQPLTLPPGVTLMCALPLAEGRMTRNGNLPSFTEGITIAAGGGSLIGIEIEQAHRHDTDIVIAHGTFTLDRCRILGDPVAGAKRGIQADPTGDSVIRWCYVDDCFQPSPGMDSQALAMWNGHGLEVLDNFLCGGSETVLLGGDDSFTADTMPTDIIIRGNTITANPAWATKPIGVKTRLELKCARRVRIEDNDITNVWAQGQVGYLLTLNVRNQEGRAPWSTIEDVVITNNRFAHGCAAISLLGHDDAPKVSGTMARVTIDGNEWTDLDPRYGNGAAGTDKLILVLQPMIDLAITNNRFQAAYEMSSLIYFDGPHGMCDGFDVTGNTFPPSTYGIFGTQGTPGGCNDPHPPHAWAYFVGEGLLTGNVQT